MPARLTSTPELTAEQVTAVETLANKIVQENRPVHVRQVTLEEAQSLPIRKLPPIAPGNKRLVDIDNFDNRMWRHPSGPYGEIG